MRTTGHDTTTRDSIPTFPARLARRRTAIARFGTDVAAAGGIGPALAAGLDPAGYPVVPGGVPQAWERAQVYLGLCERYRELYQAQLAELHLLMATAPGCSLPLPHRRIRAVRARGASGRAVPGLAAVPLAAGSRANGPAGELAGTLCTQIDNAPVPARQHSQLIVEP